MSSFDDILNRIRNRKIYDSLDEETLAQIEDDDLELAIIDYVILRIGSDWKREYEVVTGLSSGFRVVYATWVAQSEINNGGFNQFFWNSSRRFATEAMRGFEEIGARKAATLMKNAVATLVEEFPEMQKYRDEGTIEAFAESYKHTKLSDLDYEFYNLYDHGEDLAALRIRYIRTHPSLFIGRCEAS